MLGSSEQKALTQKEVSTVIQGPDGISIISDYSIPAELSTGRPSCGGYFGMHVDHEEREYNVEHRPRHQGHLPRPLPLRNRLLKLDWSGPGRRLRVDHPLPLRRIISHYVFFGTKKPKRIFDTQLRRGKQNNICFFFNKLLEEDSLSSLTSR